MYGVDTESDQITGLQSPTHFGRPNWNEIFSEKAQKHSGQKVNQKRFINRRLEFSSVDHQFFPNNFTRIAANLLPLPLELNLCTTKKTSKVPSFVLQNENKLMSKVYFKDDWNLHIERQMKEGKGCCDYLCCYSLIEFVDK